MPVENNVFKMSDDEREALGIETLPRSLSEAVESTESSPLVRRALGARVLNSFIRNKKIEWERYRSQVTDYEIKQYLPVLVKSDDGVRTDGTASPENPELGRAT